MSELFADVKILREKSKTHLSQNKSVILTHAKPKYFIYAVYQKVTY